VNQDPESSPSLFACELAAQYPREEWISLRIPHEWELLTRAITAARHGGLKTTRRCSGPFFTAFEIHREEVGEILSHPAFTEDRILRAAFDRFVADGEADLLPSCVAAGFVDELTPARLHEEANRYAVSGPRGSAKELLAALELKRADAQRFLRPFLPYMTSVAQVDVLWRERSEILLRHIQRNVMRLLADQEKTHVDKNGAPLFAFCSTSRALVFAMIERAYWPIPAAMAEDLRVQRSNPEAVQIGWNCFPFTTFPDAGVDTPPSLDSDISRAEDV
jgi:hypothetical protein